MAGFKSQNDDLQWRIFRQAIDRRKNWCAYNSSICGYQRTNEQNVVLKYLSSDLKLINISDVRDGNGCRVSRSIFGGKEANKFTLYRR